MRPLKAVNSGRSGSKHFPGGSLRERVEEGVAAPGDATQVLQTDGGVDEGRRELVPLDRPKREEVDQATGFPSAIGTPVHERTFTATPLGKTDELATLRADLARPDAGEAHHLAPKSWNRRPPVHLQQPGSRDVERACPPLTGHDDAHPGLVGPERIASRQPQVRPDLRAWKEKDRSPAAPPPGDQDPAASSALGVDDRARLGTPENDHWMFDFPEHDTATRRPERLDIEGAGGPPDPGRAQEAAARYGSHNGSISAR